MKLLVVGFALLASGAWAQHSLYGLAPLLPIAPLVDLNNPEGRVSTFSRQSLYVDRPIYDPLSIDPCRPTPCGPNTQCEVSPRGIALCRCLPGFVPNVHTVNGCKPQCTIDDDCPDDYRCRVTKCERVCLQGVCGINAECEAQNHRATCKCRSSYRGDPHTQCTKDEPVIPHDPPPVLPYDACSPSPCGSNADCRVEGDRPICTCPFHYEGDPLVNCRRSECVEQNDCPAHLFCHRRKCTDPCIDACGQGALCDVKNHQPFCSCPRDHVGDPLIICRNSNTHVQNEQSSGICNPSPCGPNTNCIVRNNRAVCSCIENYIGNPLTGCEPECVRDSDCRSSNMGCRNNICVNPCSNACGVGAYCEVRNHLAVCTCPQYYKGDPFTRCYAECTSHNECPSYQACFQLQCINPCEDACGTGANCRVDNHTPICSCPKGYTGDPFKSCRPFTVVELCNPNPCGSQAVCKPGVDSSGNDRPVCTCPTGYTGNPLVACHRGECLDHSECPSHKACYAYTCQNPCYYDGKSVCGINADCTVKNNQPVCSCPSGYIGSPLQECRITRGSIIVGRSKRK